MAQCDEIVVAGYRDAGVAVLQAGRYAGPNIRFSVASTRASTVLLLSSLSSSQRQAGGSGGKLHPIEPHSQCLSHDPESPLCLDPSQEGLTTSRYRQSLGSFQVVAFALSASNNFLVFRTSYSGKTI